MNPISNYYFDGKKFLLRSRWPKRIRTILSTLLIAASLIIVNGAASSLNQEKTFSDLKHSYITYIEKVNPDVQHKKAIEITQSILKWSNEFKLDAKMLLAISRIESDFDIYAISPSGAYGLMQVIPVWHKDKIKDAKKLLGNPEVFNINTNIYLGARVYSDCMTKHNGNINKALLCYSGQTVGYDAKVLSVYRDLKNLT